MMRGTNISILHDGRSRLIVVTGVYSSIHTYIYSRVIMSIPQSFFGTSIGILSVVTYCTVHGILQKGSAGAMWFEPLLSACARDN